VASARAPAETFTEETAPVAETPVALAMAEPRTTTEPTPPEADTPVTLTEASTSAKADIAASAKEVMPNIHVFHEDKVNVTK
jgi:hypothetical protein